MGWMREPEQIVGFVKRYWYIFLVVAAGLILMAIPSDKQDASAPVVQQNAEAAPSFSQELEEILSQIRGAGKVKLLLTQATGESILYQTDEDITGDGGIRTETVLITDTQRAQQGLVRRIDPPVYLGAVIVCQGGDNPVVRLALVEAVSSVTGLGADKITVLNMK